MKGRIECRVGGCGFLSGQKVDVPDSDHFVTESDLKQYPEEAQFWPFYKLVMAHHRSTRTDNGVAMINGHDSFRVLGENNEVVGRIPEVHEGVIEFRFGVL